MVVDIILSILGYWPYFIPVFAYGIFGRFLPAIPILNPWPIRCTVWEVRGNGYFPKWDAGKHRKDMDGNDIFDLKKSNIQTIPKKFTDAIKGIDGKNYLFLLQASKTVLIALDQDIVVMPKMKVDKKTGEPITDKDGNIEYESKDLDYALKGVLQEEKTLNWRKYALERNIKKVMREPNWLVANMPLMIGVFMIIAITIFVSVSAEPYVKITDGATRSVAAVEQLLITSQGVAETNREVTAELKEVALILKGG